VLHIVWEWSKMRCYRREEKIERIEERENKRKF